MPTTPGPIQAVAASSVPDLVRRLAATRRDQPAICSFDQQPLSYARLWEQMLATAAALNGAGIKRGDRVAIVLPNGPAMATCFLGVAAAATAAPLNPSYRAQELDFYLGDLSARAVIVAPQTGATVRQVAERRGIPVLELEQREAEGGCAGQFVLGTDCSPSSQPALAGPEDVGLVLHTSGTTSRPKLVPLSHRNLLTSADNIGRSLQLTPGDRCLNVMPLFHIHGLVGALLASLAAGGRLICNPGFDVERFLAAWERLRPTWYTAVPTIHQAILAAAEESPERFENGALRFIRSCSSSLPPSVMDRLEQRFGVPVLEAYGMTEAAHQMTCNPLPPRPRKPGSVGIPTGVEVAIADTDGQVVPHDTTGEVVIRGRNVTAGYVQHPEANAQAFTDGWFRTGDQGHFDRDGYLFLTGRLKEMINRGGENISPREIDEALLEHPAVAQALAFAAPHPTLGETVAAVVVLRAGAAATEADLRSFVAGRLSEFKVPQQLLFVDKIPKGPTGKPQRIGLADKLGVVSRPETPAAPHERRHDATTQVLAEIWQQVLGCDAIHPDDNFFLLGGDSLRVTQVLNRVRDRLGVSLPLSSMFQFPTLGALAAEIARGPRAGNSGTRSIPKRQAG